MEAGCFDVLSRGVDGGDIAAEPGERFGNEAATAAYVKAIEPQQRAACGGFECEVADGGLADIAQSRRTDTVEHPERPRGIPPLVGKRGELLEFTRVDVGAGWMSGMCGICLRRVGCHVLCSFSKP